MQDLVAGRYEVPWEAEVLHRDGTSCGFPSPTREYAGAATTASTRTPSAA
jgi:formamidase